MHSKRHYNICIFSVILGKLESFRNYYFPEDFRCNLKSYECDTFSDFSLYCIFESENLRLPFLYEKYSNLGSEM